MSAQAVKAVLRGGPSNGLEVTALCDPDRREIDWVSRSGYVYRDSGRSLRGRQIYDWVPANPPQPSREVTVPFAARVGC